jgi:kynurenine formamidase
MQLHLYRNLELPHDSRALERLRRDAAARQARTPQPDRDGREPLGLRERYGTNVIGRQLLITRRLLERGVRVTGTDGWSWDAPFSFTSKRYEETKDGSIVWEGHRASMDIGYCHMEKLTNLDQLPPTGFRISCFPFKIRAASAGFIRAVAIFED